MKLNKNEIVCFDIETTGIDKYYNEILQIAIIDGNYNTLFYSYVKPKVCTSWPDAQAVNHITPKMVEKAPYFNDIKNEVVEVLNSAKLIIGYNHERFDIPFIEYHAGVKIISRTIDVMKLFQGYICSGRFQKLSKCCEYFNIKNANAHDSLGDVRATLECFYKLI